jgi:hypothetical protein
MPERHIVGLVPSQYVRIEPYATFLAALEQAGKEIELPSIMDTPPFLQTVEPIEAAGEDEPSAT